MASPARTAWSCCRAPSPWTAADDGIRGKDYLVVEGGTVTVTAADDGLKSDNDAAGELGWILVDGGSVTVAESEEGLEAAVITITGGTVDVTASDDGLNATSGSTEGGGEQAQDGVLLTISGGTVIVDAGGDGLDSNGSATLTGGTTVISATTGGGGDGPIDVNGTVSAPAVVTIAENTVTQGRVVAIADSGGTVASYRARTTSSQVVLAAGLVSGEAYTVYVGDSAETSTDTTDGLTAAGTVTAH